MYDYSDFDEAFVRSRVAQFTDQVARRLDGSLTEDEFRPLRLMNGLYLQLHAYMLRVAIPYGSLNPNQMRQLAHIADTWDKGYGHFTTRQNIQFNWPKLPDVPAILGALADVEMHAIQTSGNCVRNVTADHFAGAAADEIADPRPYAELLRQWSMDHPEFQFLPRKFKIAITGSPNDRAVTKAHDIGLRMVRNDAGEPGFEVMVGGGLGRIIGIRGEDRVLASQQLFGHRHQQAATGHGVGAGDRHLRLACRQRQSTHVTAPENRTHAVVSLLGSAWCSSTRSSRWIIASS